MDLDRFKIYLQNFLAEGLMLVVGSGLSCAEGLPGMNQLKDAITNAVDVEGAPEIIDEWTRLRELVRTNGLEGAFKERPPSEALNTIISRAIADAVREEEALVIADVLAGRKILPLSELLPLLSFGSEGLPILTTNYDRLVELACSAAGVHVDSLFDGEFVGQLAPDRWRFSQAESLDQSVRSGRSRFRYRAFARVLKPHGSLDWWSCAGRPVRHTGIIAETQAIVTPGLLKYREGYNEPFNTHRNVANERMATCARLLFLGYGFNDDHLEATTLKPVLESGREAVIVSRTLTDNARAALHAGPKVSAIEALDPDGAAGTRVHFRGETLDVPGCEWWHLKGLVDGVLKP